MSISLTYKPCLLSSTRAIDELGKQIIKLKKEYNDLKAYIGKIGDGTVSLADLADVPESMRAREQNFILYSDQFARIGASQAIASIFSMPQVQNMFATTSPAQQQMYQQQMYAQLYQQEHKKAVDIEVNMLQEKETEIETRMLDLEDQKRSLADFNKTCSEELPKEAEKMAIKA